jgi:hypothetical protein
VILAQKTDRRPSSYWLVRPGSIYESLVQLSLGDRVEKCHAWSPPVLSFSRSINQKRGLLLRAMPPITYEGSSIRPIASTYNVMITLVYPFLVVQRTVAPPTRKGRNMETSLPFGSENLWRKSAFKFPETARLYSQRE